MNQEKIVVIDYGVGNIYSLSRALEKCGSAKYMISSDINEIKNADKIILPGVGAFEDGMNGLKSRNLIDVIIKHALDKKPLLGICLGMQLLTTSSEEFGVHAGLGLIPGRVKRMSDFSLKGNKRKIPSVGWSELTYEMSNNNVQSLFKGIPNEASVYFVHSYQVLPDSNENLMASYDFEGDKIAAVINAKNIYGVQFHPEKSGHAGLKILSNFINL